MSAITIAGDTSGSITLDAPAIAGTTVLTLPATSGTVITSASIASQSVNFATSAGTAARAPEWQASGSTSNWNTQFQDTDASSATQIDLNSGVNCPTGGGWWFAESFRHGNSSSFWGTQYAHGWEDRAYQRYVRNVSTNNFGSWQLDTGCRAWVNFNGTGTVSIRSSGNVSSISDNGTGDYTVNFITAMLDANYSYTHAYSNEVNQQHTVGFFDSSSSGALRVRHYSAANSGATSDKSLVSISVFR